MKLLFDVIMILIYIFLGAINIESAVEYFKEKKYYRFGLNVILAIVLAALIIIYLVKVAFL